MLTGSTTLAAAAAAAARATIAALQMDFGRTGTYTDYAQFVTSWSVRRSFTTDVPAGSRYVAGYSSAQLDLTVQGNVADNSQHGAWYWSPYNVASPVYNRQRIGTPVRALAGFTTSAGTEMLPRFSGAIKAIEASSADRSADLTVADGFANLQAQPVIPMIIGQYATGRANEPIMQNLYATSIVDYLLRQNGYYASPPPRSGCILSVTGHGSMEPDRSPVAGDGTQVQYGTTRWAWGGGDSSTSTGKTLVPYSTTQGQFSQVPDPTSSGMSARWYPLGANWSNYTPAQGDTFVVEAWVDLSNPLAVPAGQSLIGFRLSLTATTGISSAITIGFMGDSRPYISSGNPGGAVTYGTGVTGAKGWTYMRCVITFTSATAVSAAFALNGTAATAGRTLTYSPGSIGSLTDIAVGGFDASATNGARARWEALQVTFGETNPPSNYGFVPTADIEPSSNRLTVTPYTGDKDSSADVLQELTRVEFGTFWFDELGVAQWWSRRHFTAQTSSVLTLTSSAGINTLTTLETDDAIVNQATATITPFAVQPASWIYKASSVIGIHSNATYRLTAELDTLAGPLTGTGQFIPAGGFPSGQEQHGYRACRTPDGTGQEIYNLQMTVTGYANRALISLYNPNPWPVYLVCPQYDSAGNPYTAYTDPTTPVPMVWLWGQPIVQAIPGTTEGSAVTSATSTTTQLTSRDATSIALYAPPGTPGQPRTYDLGASDWLQLPDEVQAILDDIVAQCAYVVPQLSDVDILSDPRLQLGDRITLQDTTGLQLATDAIVVDIDESGDSTGHRQTVQLRAIGGANALIWDDPVRGVLDSTNLWTGAL